MNSLTVKAPTGFESGEPRQSLLPADVQGMGKFPETVVCGTKTKVPYCVSQRAQEHRPRPIKCRRRAGPDCGQRLAFAETALGRLRGSVIVGMHDHRAGTIADLISLRAAPARVFVVL